MEIVARPEPPTGLRRLLFRLPNRLYRVGLGRLVPARFLYLIHIGRKSGRRRDVVLEVVGTREGSYYLCSGFGEKADWYRNVLATPEVDIQVRGRVSRARVVPLEAEGGADVMAAYGARNPTLGRKLARYMGFAVDGGEADFREVGRRMPFVRLDPA
ncbi:nitroreductase family deazaflavin-dependent oxidoreductase [Prauserella sp. ASG 168]|uniref:Nitroreductase family deazaflavin-dependent oxidoreductase n=1 Tax=Prauserella cavernicola TaxID=2800127 RepID=A0A934V5Z2_9PSEU|nr:nitroreductase family deazaflavin-dependent oxidoreductase [Prauserella cavernicola]